MEENKIWYESITIRAAIVSIIALLASAFNIVIDVESQSQILSLTTILLGVFSSSVSIYGRIVAKKTIKTTK